MTQQIHLTVQACLRSAAVLYGCMPLRTLFRSYAHLFGDGITEETFYRMALRAQGPGEPFRIIGDDDIYRADLSVADGDRIVVHRRYCYATWDALFTLECSQEGKEPRLFTKEEMLSYAEGDYLPDTPQIRDLQRMLRQYSQEAVPLQQIMLQAVALAMDDGDAPTFLKEMQHLGCRFGSMEDRLTVARCYRQVWETVPKPIHNGHSDREMKALMGEDKPLQRCFLWFCPGTQGDGFRLDPQWLTGEYPTTGITDYQQLLDRCLQEQTLPHRLLEPCYCGSGLYYEDCCGKR